MQFNSARGIEQLVWQMRLSDYPRSLNRARINSLANGAPPVSEAEAERNGVEINVNDLSLTRLSHEARLQLAQAFNKPGNFFTARTDMGSVSRRQERGVIVTKGINKYLKQSDHYYEGQRSQLASQVLHGIGPKNWDDPDRWCNVPVGIEDVLMPTNTKLTFRNLPFFAVWRGFSAAELTRLTRSARRGKNPGWNLPVVDRAIKWVDEQATQLYSGQAWAEYWSPEKRAERIKSDSGIYASDLCPTIDCYDFYYWDDSRRHEGWRRRIIFDAWGGASAWSGSDGYGARGTMPDKNLLDEKNLFLYSSGDRVVEDDIHKLMHFQFADLSAVAPFNYHSIRSLGFLLYAVCHLQNRLRCSFSEAVFENMMMYMRVTSLDDAERALKIEMANRGIIDESVKFLSPQERWQPNAQMVELGLNEFKQTIADNSSSYVQNTSLSKDRVEKTKFQVMAEVNAMQTLVSAGLQMSYRYANMEYREIFRRFMKKGSTDPDVRDFRARVLARGVPEKMLVPDAWDIEPERIMGSGNKTLEMAIAQQLMDWRGAYSPESQQKILRAATLSVTDDASWTNDLVPFQPGISNDRHDAMVAFGSLMAGAEVAFKSDQNTLEITTTLIGELAMVVQQTLQMGGVPSQDKLMGMQNALQSISRLVPQVAADKTQKDTAKKLAEASGKLANEIKGFAQRVQEKAASQNGSGGEEQAKIQATLMQAKVKEDANREAHSQKTAQRQVQFEMEEKRKQQAHDLDMRRQVQTDAIDIAAKDAETSASIQHDTAKTKAEVEATRQKAQASATTKSSDQE
jgi:hypothetical protein